MELALHYRSARIVKDFWEPDREMIVVDVDVGFDSLPDSIKLEIVDIINNKQPRSTTTMPPNGTVYRTLDVRGDLSSFGANGLSMFCDQHNANIQYLLLPFRNSSMEKIIKFFEESNDKQATD